MSLGLKLLKSPRFPSTKEIDSILATLFNIKKKEILIKNEKINLCTDHSFAPTDCLLSLLVTFMINLDGLSAICLLWKEFIHEIRWHWEQNPPKLIPLINIPKDSIDMKRCLIYQKLEMINYCISLANNDFELEELKKSNRIEKDGWEISFGFDEDDYDHDDDDNYKFPSRQGADQLLNPKKLLLKFIDEKIHKNFHFIYVPLTQNLGLITEDLIEEQQQAMTNQLHDEINSQHHLQLKSGLFI